MRLQVKGKNVRVTESIREYTETKLAKLDRQLAADTKIEVELTEESGARHVAGAAIFTKGPTLRAHESAPDVRASIDRLVDNLERQVTRYVEKRRTEPRRRTARNGV